MTDPEDRDLAARFAELRSSDARQAPPFASMLPKAPRRRVVALPWNGVHWRLRRWSSWSAA